LFLKSFWIFFIEVQKIRKSHFKKQVSTFYCKLFGAWILVGVVQLAHVALNNLARCGIPPRNKDENIFRLGQYLSKAVCEADASLVEIENSTPLLADE
jgi:hypothetical protein